jgi:hypothetical protein
VNAGSTITLTITINGEALAEGQQYFGRINLVPLTVKAHPVTLPVAFFTTQGDVTLSHSCAAAAIPVRGSTSCSVTATNGSASDANYDLSLKGPGPKRLQITNVSSPGVSNGNGFTASGTLNGAAAPPIISITPGGSPAGYLPLSLFGITPIGGMGDETLANFSTPAFSFGSETYTRLGVTSNGYLVVGGGGSGDLDFVPQTFPDPAAPNNVLAPFWTDLNPGAAGAVRIAVLTDGVNDWIVVDWDGVRTFESASHTQQFEVWIQTNVESVTYAYGTITGPTAPLNVGAENRDGSSGVNLGSVPVSGSDDTITAGAPTAGGSVTVTYTAVGVRRGTYSLPANLESDITPGVTTRVVTIQVT